MGGYNESMRGYNESMRGCNERLQGEVTIAPYALHQPIYMLIRKELLHN